MIKISFARVALCSAVFLCGMSGLVRAASMAEVEAQRCEERIASVHRDVLGRYEDGLVELQSGFQKAADLDGALAVRAERQRLAKDQRLTEQNLVAEPKGLRALQSTHLAKLKELSTQLVQETLPKLLEMKKSLTVAGKLDEAVAVRVAIERLQNVHAPISRPEAGAVVAVDAVLQAYQADRDRADKTYKGQRIVLRGTFAGCRPDPNDAKLLLVYVSAPSGGWLQCAFSANDYRFREDKVLNNVATVLTPKNDESKAVRLQKGQSIDIRGVCEGMNEVVQFGKCDFAR